MKVNLHTHTARCHHAQGADEEYVLEAINRGLRTLGFSDHTPQFYPNGHISSVRMLPGEFPGYVNSVLGLRDSYKEKLRILLGVEAEYYPAYFGDLIPFLQDHGVEYMLLGQHNLGNEIGEPHCGKPTEDEGLLKQYCHQVMDAMQTGYFTYFAHPDIMNFIGDGRIYDRHMRQVCRTAKDCGVPLEINMLGLREGRHYPNDRFFALVAEENCPVVIGSDAHLPKQVLLPDNEAQALEIVQRFGLNLIAEPQIKRI